MVKRVAALAVLVLCGLAVMAGMGSPAQARVFVGIGVGVPAFYPAPYYYPPYYYAPPPVVYTPPPVYYVNPPAPAPSGPASTSSQYWYYCDDPQGYYPYVAQCNAAWRQVAPQPAGH